MRSTGGFGKQKPRCFAQPTLGSVSDNSIAKPLGRRKADADVSAPRTLLRSTGGHLKHE